MDTKQLGFFNYLTADEMAKLGELEQTMQEWQGEPDKEKSPYYRKDKEQYERLKAKERAGTLTRDGSDWDVGLFEGNWFVTKNGQKFKGPFASMNLAENWIKNNKPYLEDHDATEGGSIKQYGQETKTMNIEDAMDPGKASDYIKTWEKRKSDAERDLANAEVHLKELHKEHLNFGEKYHKERVKRYEEAKRAAEAQIKQYSDLIKNLSKSVFGQKDEAPTDVKDTKADGDPETMTTREAREYWNKYHNSDPILEDYPSFEAWYRESKQNGYIVDEEAHRVQDSFEMLKLCGIVADVGEKVFIDHSIKGIM